MVYPNLNPPTFDTPRSTQGRIYMWDGKPTIPDKVWYNLTLTGGTTKVAKVAESLNKKGATLFRGVRQGRS